MTILQYNSEEAQRLLALDVTPESVAQRHPFLQVFAPRLGERILDVGSGPGFLAAAMAEAVGATGAVSGVDISEPLLAVARTHCAPYPWVDFQHSDATRRNCHSLRTPLTLLCQRKSWKMSGRSIQRWPNCIASSVPADGWP